MIPLSMTPLSIILFSSLQTITHTSTESQTISQTTLEKILEILQNHLYSFMSYMPLASIILGILSLHFLNSYKSSKYSVISGCFSISFALISIFHYCGVSYITNTVETINSINSINFWRSTLFISFFIFGGCALGTIVAKKIKMESLPELMAAFHSLIGLSALITDICFGIEWYTNSESNPMNFAEYKEMLLQLLESSKQAKELGQSHNSLQIIAHLTPGVLVGAVTFIGSIVAFFKLRNSNKITKICEKVVSKKNANIFNLALINIIFTLCICSYVHCIYTQVTLSFVTIFAIAFAVALFKKLFIKTAHHTSHNISNDTSKDISQDTITAQNTYTSRSFVPFLIISITSLATIGLFHIILQHFFIHQAFIIYSYIIIFLSCVLGVTSLVFISGADMAIAISVLNAYSGWAAVAVGLSIQNIILVVIGMIVAVSGSMLSYFMCKSMNKSIIEVLFKFKINSIAGDEEEKPIQIASPQDVSFAMQNAFKVLIIPGYGMAASQAQHALKNITEMLEKKSIEVEFGIHPVAGRMPGHMNVLLAEANIGYEHTKEIDEVNGSISTYDLALVVGANDTVNPSAKTDKNSPLYGMEVFDLPKVKQIFFIKRSMNVGYAGVSNTLFYYPQTKMIFGQAKTICEDILKSLESDMNE